MNIHGRIEELHELLRQLWSADTSPVPDLWDENNPSANQCAPSSLLARHIFGGVIVRVEYTLHNGDSDQHFFNILPHVGIYDFTLEQFPLGTKFSPALISSEEILIESSIEFLVSSGYNPANTGSEKMADHLLRDPATRKAFLNLKDKYEELSRNNQPGFLAEPETMWQDQVKGRKDHHSRNRDKYRNKDSDFERW